MTKPEWMEYKPTLGFDFPNLPFYQVLFIFITDFLASDILVCTSRVIELTWESYL